MRRDQSKTRADIGIVEWDDQFDLVKINPLAAWTETQVWAYIIDNGVPYNELHDHELPEHRLHLLHQARRPGDDPRSGRWQGFDKRSAVCMRRRWCRRRACGRSSTRRLPGREHKHDPAFATRA